MIKWSKTPQFGFAPTNAIHKRQLFRISLGICTSAPGITHDGIFFNYKNKVKYRTKHKITSLRR